jgi:hypothetical protein
MSKNTKLTKESVPIAENGQEASVGEHPNAITNR